MWRKSKNKTVFIGLTSALSLFFAIHFIPRAFGTRYIAAALLAPVAIFTMPKNLFQNEKGPRSHWNRGWQGARRVE